MKVVAGSTRGRSGRGGGRGGSRGGRGAADAVVPERREREPQRDPRFAGRLDQARFSRLQAPSRENRQREDDVRAKLVQQDPRFRAAPVDSRGHRRGAPVPEEEDADEEEEEEEEVEDDSSDAIVNEDELEEDEEGAEDDAIDDEDDEAVEFQESDIEEIDPTHRIAVVNCDWDHIRAVDLFAVFFHTLPLGGRLHKVEVFLSDFGKAQLEHERQHGPDLWVKARTAEELQRVQESNAATMADIQNEASYIDASGAPEIPEEEEFEYDAPEMFVDVGDEGEVFSGGKYRQYELNRMKYYYAVAEFDSAETAAAVYRECDGMDVEASGVVLDLRYVPDEETFDPERIHNSATRLPPRYKPLKAFRAAALSQTRFKISWDQDDAHRVQSLREAFTDDTDEGNLRAYLASESSSDEDEMEVSDAAKSAKERRLAKRAAIRSKYAALLADIGGLSSELPPEDDNGDNEDDADAGVVAKGSDDEGVVDGDEEEEESDDDDLNRLSDVSFEEEEDEEGDEDMSGENEEDDEDGQVEGNMVGTFDLNAGDRAQQVATELRRKKLLASADLGTAERMKYKLKRKEAKQAKKEKLTAQRAAQDEEFEATKESRKAFLASRLGDAVEETVAKAKGKKARREMAKALKVKSLLEKKEAKKRRAVSRLGGDKAVEEVDRKKASEASSQLDSRFGRFADRLLHDPRFHVDPTSERARQNRDVSELAATVNTARRVQPAAKKAADASSKPPAATAAASGVDVDFFLKQSQNPRGKRSRSAAGVP